jgi:hypothetical protein
MNIVEILGWVLVLGGAFGTGVSVARFYDDWRGQRR